MTRYLRLYACLVRFSCSRAMEFRIDSFFRVVMDLAFYAMHISFFSILYRHTAGLGGWSYDQALIFICGYFVVDALQMTFLADNAWGFGTLVNRGDFDYYLARPVSSLFFASLRDFAASSLVNVAAAAGLMTWSIARFPADLPALRVGMYFALLLAGTFLFYLLQMLFVVPVFWLHSTHGLGEVFHTFTGIIGRPDRIFRGWTRRVLLSLLPFGLMVSVPARVLFDGLGPWTLLHICTVAAGGFALLLWFWGRGLRAYGSASS